MNISGGFARDHFYGYTLPAILLAWLVVVLMVGAWLTE